MTMMYAEALLIEYHNGDVVAHAINGLDSPCKNHQVLVNLKGIIMAGLLQAYIL